MASSKITVETLATLVESKPLIILRFSDEEWQQLDESRRGVHEFTIARSHALLSAVKTPTLCLLFGKGLRGAAGFLGILSSRGGATTIQTRIKVRRALQISPNDEEGLLQLVTAVPHASNLRQRLRTDSLVVPLSPKLGRAVIVSLASVDQNHGLMRVLANSMTTPTRFSDMPALEEDAVQTALRAFGVAAGEEATTVQLVENRETALARLWTSEDLVIQHDARSIPGYELRRHPLSCRIAPSRAPAGSPSPQHSIVHAGTSPPLTVITGQWPLALLDSARFNGRARI